jgi:hypothetical protein
LSYYEKTLEEMTNTKLDDSFNDELRAIENWFNVLSQPERTACIYSLLKGITPLQTRFFITVLQQMAAKDASMDPLSASLLMSPQGMFWINQWEDHHQSLQALRMKSEDCTRGPIPMLAFLRNMEFELILSYAHLPLKMTLRMEKFLRRRTTSKRTLLEGIGRFT